MYARVFSHSKQVDMYAYRKNKTFVFKEAGGPGFFFTVALLLCVLYFTTYRSWFAPLTLHPQLCVRFFAGKMYHCCCC